MVIIGYFEELIIGNIILVFDLFLLLFWSKVDVDVVCLLSLKYLVLLGVFFKISIVDFRCC